MLKSIKNNIKEYVVKSYNKKSISLLTILAIVMLFGQNNQSYAQSKGEIIGKVIVKGMNLANSPQLKVSTKGGVADAVIFIKGVKSEFQSDPLTIDQKNKEYVPRVSVTMKGNSVIYVNSDALLHNVHIIKEKNTLENFVMVQGNKNITKKLNDTGVIDINCDVHPDMRGYIVVTENPYYAITNTAGLFRIKDIPEGIYKISIWQEKLGIIEKTITVKAGKKSAVILEYNSNWSTK